jgi:hypothetical protein
MKAAASSGTKDKYDEYAYATWRNNLAVLIGIAGMGIRFDLVMDGEAPTTSDHASTDNNKTSVDRWENGAGISLTWGMIRGKLSPYAQLGYKFPDTYYYHDMDGKKKTTIEGAALGLKAGAGLDLTDSSGLDFALVIGGQLPDDYSGDKDAAGLGEDPYTIGGTFGMGLEAGFSQTINADKLTMKFRPGLSLDFISVSNDTTRGGNSKKNAADGYFNLGLGVDLGIKYQINEKFAVYTGGGLSLFEWNTHGMLGGEDDTTGKTEASEWQVTGIKWDAKKSADGKGNLGFGLTFAPSQNIIIGAGLNTILDNIFYVNLAKMEAGTGTWFDGTHSSAGNFLGEALGLFTDVKFDLTVSVKL